MISTNETLKRCVRYLQNKNWDDDMLGLYQAESIDKWDDYDEEKSFRQNWDFIYTKKMQANYGQEDDNINDETFLRLRRQAQVDYLSSLQGLIDFQSAQVTQQESSDQTTLFGLIAITIPRIWGTIMLIVGIYQGQYLGYFCSYVMSFFGGTCG